MVTKILFEELILDLIKQSKSNNCLVGIICNDRGKSYFKRVTDELTKQSIPYTLLEKITFETNYYSLNLDKIELI
ncbi:MAG: hypothetical protein AABW81_03890 [Nanoarchaeota archaeon]